MKSSEKQPWTRARSRKRLCLAALHICVLTLTMLLSSGCATIVSKSRYPVSIITEPPAATKESTCARPLILCAQLEEF
jgi:hypothetical protein